MTTLSTDTFIRADQSGFGTASDGETWARSAGVGVSNIVSDQGKIGPGGNDSQFLIGLGTAATINMLCRVKSGDSGNVAAVLFRYSTTGGTNGYRAGIFGANLVVDKYVTGTRSNIASTGVSYNVGEEWWIHAIASGSSITVSAWKDGGSEPSPQISITDSSISAAGQYGISVFMANDFTYFDSLTITDNASVTTSTRTVTATAALLATTSRTVTDTAALLASTTRTMNSTAALLATKTRTVGATSALQATSSRSLAASAALLSTATRTVPGSAPLQATASRTMSATVALLASSARSMSATAALRATNARSIAATAALSSLARTVPCSVALQASSTRTIAATASLSGASTIVYNATCYVRSGAATCSVHSGTALCQVRSGAASISIT